MTSSISSFGSTPLRVLPDATDRSAAADESTFSAHWPSSVHGKVTPLPVQTVDDSPRRVNLLVMSRGTLSARRIRRALIPPETENDGAPLLTYCQTLHGALFCLEPQAEQPDFDAILVDFSTATTEISAAVVARALDERHANLPRIAILADDVEREDFFPSAEFDLVLAAADLCLGRLAAIVANTHATSQPTVPKLHDDIRRFAEDVRDPLSCVQLAVDLMRQQVGQHQAVEAETLDLVARAVRRSDELVGRLARDSRASVETVALPG